MKRSSSRDQLAEPSLRSSAERIKGSKRRILLSFQANAPPPGGYPLQRSASDTNIGGEWENVPSRRGVRSVRVLINHSENYKGKSGPPVQTWEVQGGGRYKGRRGGAQSPALERYAPKVKHEEPKFAKEPLRRSPSNPFT
jgi:hypothetical protein